MLKTSLKTGAVAIAISVLTAVAISPAMAQQQPQPQRSGTPEEQKACGPDVTKFCRTVMNDGDLVILSCLQQNRPKISRACNQVLVSHGQ